MRTKGYKCYNVKCKSCICKTLCGEPANTALGCASRVIDVQNFKSRTDVFDIGMAPAASRGGQHMSEQFELKPCPFCGGIGVMQVPNMHRITCVSCKECMASTKWGTPEEVAASWNRRAGKEANNV